jgi:hypothetical protein
MAYVAGARARRIASGLCSWHRQACWSLAKHAISSTGFDCTGSYLAAKRRTLCKFFRVVELASGREELISPAGLYAQQSQLQWIYHTHLPLMCSVLIISPHTLSCAALTSTNYDSFFFTICSSDPPASAPARRKHWRWQWPRRR